jgi:ATP-binding cassette subfamily C protein CydCD
VSAGGGLVLSGPTGSGKSTVLATLLRTVDPRAGRAAMDGVDLGELAGDDVRGRIAWCGPASHLFVSTLRENLRLARPDAPDDRIVEALRRAGLGAWLAGLPEGLDTPVGRHGGTVSGGERQRIGLARALLADRPLLLLDEPTAHLDDATAARVRDDVLSTAAHGTTVVTSHRPEGYPGWLQLRLPAPEAPEPRAGARDPAATSTADGSWRSGP